MAASKMENIKISSMSEYYDTFFPKTKKKIENNLSGDPEIIGQKLAEDSMRKIQYIFNED